MENVLSRQALYDLVWAEPVKTVAQRFGMSDVAFKKYCLRGSVPVPERGYWAKLAAGKPVSRFPLPRRDPGASDFIRIGPYRYGGYNYDPEKELAKPEPEPPTFDEALESVRERSARRLGKLKYVRDLASPCVGLRKLLQDEAKRILRQQTERFPSYWDKPVFESGFEKRRLKILNSLGLGLAKAQSKLEVRGQAGREIVVTVGDTSIKLHLDHPQAKANRHGEWDVREGAADTLKLSIGPEKDRAEGYQAIWEDGADGKLEDHLTEIALEIVVAGKAELRANAHRSYAWALERRVEHAREIERRRVEAERLARERRAAALKARREQLFAQAADWRSAQDIRGFVASVLAQPGQAPSSEALAAWADWALSEAAALDPVTSGGLSLPDLSEA